jgi:hypothetical protein
MTRPPAKTALERLQDAGELTLVRSAWCEPEPGKPGEWRQVLTATQGLLLLSEGLAVYRDRRLRPA